MRGFLHDEINNRQDAKKKFEKILCVLAVQKN